MGRRRERQGMKDDDLRAARGIVWACLASAAIWLLVVIALALT